MVAVVAAGFSSLAVAFVNIPFEKVDLYFLTLFCFTIGVGSRVSIKIPQFKSHIAVSDTFIFLALLMFGGELAIILAGVEAFFSSWRFCSKKITIFFNTAAVALSTTAVIFVLKILGFYTESQLHGHGENLQNFIVVLSVIALTQFIVNTSLCSVHDSLKGGIPLLETWKSKYIWSFLTYFVGAATAGILLQLSDSIGFGVILATFPVIFFIFLTYRMYMKNVEMSAQQATQAEQYAEVLKARSAELRESEQRFRSAFNYAPIGIALVSPAGEWLRVNHALSSILGYSEEEFLATDFQSIIFLEDLGPALVMIHELLSGKTANSQMEQRYFHKTGRTVWVLGSVSTTSDLETENTTTLIFQIQDITDRKMAEEKLQYEATHDVLTGLPNRSFFMRRLAEALQRQRQNPKYQVSILFIDLDRFKYVNDSLGHFIGDQLLVGISQRLRDSMRPPDIVARLGGDEFVILVEGRYYMEKVTDIAERIQRSFTAPFDLNGHEVYSSASIGILHATAKHLTSEDMIRDADTAMYQAKRSGRARHEVFNENMHKSVKETLLLETDLRRALENDEFLVYYQPIVSLITGKVQGVEALARWEHGDLGLISPSKFVPLAEEIGLIDELGEQILRKACVQIGSLTNFINDESNFRLSVNISCRQFAHTGLVRQIKTILDETKFPADSLKLEITESVFFEYQERAIEMLHQLRMLGIDIDIDDFGTGYSNLSYLVRLPISALKIDRSFVKPISEDGANTEIVRTILAMARNLGLRVIAEGVETKEQLEALKQLKCEGAQGYLFAKPMPFEDVRTFLEENENIEIPNTRFDDVSVVTAIQ